MNFAIKDSLAYPAAQKAIEYAPKGVTGWFIGSIAQNKAISNNLEKVYSSFSIIGGTLMVGTGVLQKMEQEKILLKCLH